MIQEMTCLGHWSLMTSSINKMNLSPPTLCKVKICHITIMDGDSIGRNCTREGIVSISCLCVFFCQGRGWAEEW